MSDQTDTLGGRLPLADPAVADGRLIGPFNPALLNRAIAAPLLDLQFAEQVHTSLSARVREVIIFAILAPAKARHDFRFVARPADASRPQWSGGVGRP